MKHKGCIVNLFLFYTIKIFKQTLQLNYPLFSSKWVVSSFKSWRIKPLKFIKHGNLFFWFIWQMCLLWQSIKCLVYLWQFCRGFCHPLSRHGARKHFIYHILKFFHVDSDVIIIPLDVITTLYPQQHCSNFATLHSNLSCIINYHTSQALSQHFK